MSGSLAVDPAAEVMDLCVAPWSFWNSSDTKVRLDEYMTFVDDVELAEPDYSFDLLRLWVRKSDGAILYATDSGCSCPSPFEDTLVKDLSETNLAGLDRLADEYGSDSSDSWRTRTAAQVRADLHALIPQLKEAGAK